MEDALRVELNKKIAMKMQDVLILIIMEDTLRANIHYANDNQLFVS